MKAVILLTNRYIKQHIRQFGGIFFCITILASAIFAVLMLRDSFLETNRQLWNEVNGTYTATIYNADASQVEQMRETLRQNGSGVATVTDAVSMSNMGKEEIPYIGTLDENTMALRSIKVEEGRLPNTKDEIAIERSTYSKLKRTENLGDSVTLPIQTKNGIEERTYKLVGYLSDYVNFWIAKEQPLFIADGITDPIQIPGIVIAEASAPPAITTTVTCSKDYGGGIKGTSVGNWDYNSDNPLQDSQKIIINAIIAGFFLFLVLIIILGIWGIVNMTMRERIKYVGVLRCIGLTGGQTIAIFLLQGLYLALASTLACFAVGFGGVAAAGAILNAIGHTFLLQVTYLPFLITFLVVTATLLIIYIIQTFRLLRNAPLEFQIIQRKPVRRNRFSWKLPVLWGRATAKPYRTQNLLITVLVTGFMILTLMGSFCAIFIPRVNYAGALDSDQSVDYSFGFGSASSSAATFHIPFPRNVGVTPENLEILRSTKGLDVSFAGISTYARQFIVAPKKTDSPFLKELKQKRGIMENEQSDYVLREADADPSDVLLEAPVTGIDAKQLKQLEPYIVAGKIDYEQFAAGKEIVVDQSYYEQYGLYSGQPYFHVGDTYKIAMPILPETATRDELNGKVSVKTFNVKIGAILSSEKRGDKNATLYPFDGSILISAEQMMAADPSLRYDTIIAKIQDGISDTETLANIHSTIYQIAAQSKGIYVTDLPQERANYAKEIQNLAILIGMSVIVFLIVITVALFMMTNINVKLTIRSYLLMRAVGLDSKGMRRLIFRQNRKNIFMGVGIGGIISFGLCAYWAWQNFFIYTLDVFLFVMIPCFIFLSALLLIISIVACIPPIKKVDRISVIEKLHEVDY